jgi:hypothetical protein
MKKLRNLIAVMAMMSMAAVLTGCGDDDDDDDDDQPPVNNIVAPATEADLTAQNKTYTVTIPGDTNNIVLTFPSSGRYQAVQGESTEQGAISGAVRDVNTWTFNVTPDAGQEGAQAGSVRLDFTAADQGTWTFTPEGGTAETGTFVLTTNPGGGDDGGDTGGGAAPASLEGRRIQLATTGAGQELLTFTGATSGTFTSDIANPAAGGTFTYTPTGNTAVLDLQYDTPAAAANDFSNLTLTFDSGTAGTFTGNQHFEGADHDTSGNFSLP